MIRKTIEPQDPGLLLDISLYGVLEMVKGLNITKNLGKFGASLMRLNIGSIYHLMPFSSQCYTIIQKRFEVNDIVF
jgi:hypothetical protein